MAETSVYHNPRCSKSREVIALLEEKGVDFRPVLYMEQGLSRDELAGLLRKLGIPARDLLRSSEKVYRERGLSDPARSEVELIDAMVEEPRLMQRPIVVKGRRAVVARPAKRALELVG